MGAEVLPLTASLLRGAGQDGCHRQHSLPAGVSGGTGEVLGGQASLPQRTGFGAAQATAAAGSPPSARSPARANQRGSCSWLCPSADPTGAGLSRDGFQCWRLNNCAGQSTPSLQRSKRRGSPAAWESTYPAALAALPASPRLGEGKGVGREVQLFIRNVKGS